MPDFILPNPSPPHISETAKDRFVDTIFNHGLTSLYELALPAFRNTHPDLTDYIMNFKPNQSSALIEYDMPIRVFRTAAVITGFAYADSGYETSVSGDIFVTASLEAEFDGIPETYIEKYMFDQKLHGLMDLLLDAPEMQDGKELWDFDQIAHIGAGCTRHFLQYALAA